MHIAGSYSISADGIVSGDLTLSIKDEILRQIPGGKPAFFGEPDPVTLMSSTAVKLGGTNTDPTEDLTPRIQAAIEQYRKKSAAPRASDYPTIPRAPGAKSEEDKTKDKRNEEAFNKLLEP